MTLLMLCWEFFKTGLFSVGGGLATLPFLFEMSNKHPEWFSVEDLTNMVAVAESTPGPIGVNMATYIGTTVAGIPGGILATLSLILPSLITILIIARILAKFSENMLVKDIFYGLRPAVVGMLFASVLSVFESSLFGGNFINGVNFRYLVLFAVLVFAIFKFKKHPILYIGIGALIGIIFKF